MSSTSSKHPLRWFLLLWMGLLFIQGLAESPGDQGIFMTTIHLNMLNATILALLFTFFIMIHGILHGLALFGIIHKRRLFAYFIGQGFLVLLLLSFAGRRFVVFGLCLILTIEAIHLLRWTRLLMLVVSGYLALYVFAVQPQNYFINSDLEGSLIKSIDSLALILFAAACVFLYHQQAQAHLHDQELLHELEQTHAQLETAHIQLEDYAARVEALTLLTERQRLARELHDTLAQGLVGLTMQLETVNGLLLRTHIKEARTIVQHALHHTRASLAEARYVIDDLRQEPLDSATFLKLFQGEIYHFTASTNLDCATDLEMLTAVPHTLYMPVIRFIGEALTNIARHAHAHQVWIQMKQLHGQIVIDIRDNGIGFDPASAIASTGHYGLLGLYERAQLVSGTLEIHSKKEMGTVLRFILPPAMREPYTFERKEQT